MHRFRLLAIFCAIVYPILSFAQESETVRIAPQIECISLGEPNAGYLINGVPLPPGPGYLVRAVDRTYGTPEMIVALIDAVGRVRVAYPDTAALVVGDLSYPKGGRIRDHRSHTNGRDVDLGLYDKDNRQLYTFVPMGEANLDVAKSWTLIESMLAGDKVELIFMSRDLQAIFYQYARDVRGVPDDILAELFEYPRPSGARVGTIRWAKGHRDHIHVRFRSPAAGAAASHYTTDDLMRMRAMQPHHGYVAFDESAKSAGRFTAVGRAEAVMTGRESIARFVHNVEDGDSLGDLAALYRVSPEQIRAWNWLGESDTIEDRKRLVLYLAPSGLQSREPGSAPAYAEGISTDGFHRDPETGLLDFPLSAFRSFVVSVSP